MKRTSATFGTALVLALGLALTAAGASAQDQAAQPGDEVRQIEATILGMSCPFCAYGVEQKLKRLEGVTDLEVALETGLATLSLADGADVSNEVLQKTVKEAGFEVAKIVRNFESGYPDWDRGDESLAVGRGVLNSMSGSSPSSPSRPHARDAVDE